MLVSLGVGFHAYLIGQYYGDCGPIGGQLLAALMLFG
jgi:hypothetical protein